MGIFSSSTKYHAFVQATPLIEEEDKTDTLSTFVYSAAKHDDEDMAANIIAATQAGLPALARSYYTYGKNHYKFGLPYGGFTFQQISVGVAAKAVQRNTGQQITDKDIIEIRYPLNYAEAAGIIGVTKLSFWDPNLSRIAHNTTSHGPAYIKPFSFSFVVQRTFSQGAAFELTTRFRLYYDWDDPNNQTGRPTYWESSSRSINASVEGTYVWIIYKHNGVIQTLLLQYPSDQFPLEHIITKEERTFYPISIYISDSKDFNSDEHWKKTLKALNRKININADDVLDQFYTGLRETGAPKNLKYLDFTLGFFISLSYLGKIKGKEGSHRYKFEFLNELAQVNGGSRSDFIHFVDSYKDWVKYHANINQEDLVFPSTEKKKAIPPKRTMEVTGPQFYYELSWSFMVRYTSYISHENARKKIADLPANIPDDTREQTIEGMDKFGDKDVYVVIHIVNLEGSFYVNLPNGLWKEASPGKGAQCPICYEILKKLPFREQEQVLQDSLYGLISTVIKEEIKWYQKSFWKGIILAITIAVVAFTLQVGINGLLGAIGVTKGSIAFFALGHVLRFTVTMLVQFTGNLVLENPVITSIISMIISAGLTTAGGFEAYAEGLFKNLTPEPTIAYLSKITGLGSKAYSVYSKITSYNDDTDFSDMISTAEEKKEQLEAAYAGMEAGANIVDPHLELSRRLSYSSFESPEEFYARTTETNPGERVLQIPSTFVEQTLRLPRSISDVTGADSTTR